MCRKVPGAQGFSVGLTTQNNPMPGLQEPNTCARKRRWPSGIFRVWEKLPISKSLALDSQTGPESQNPSWRSLTSSPSLEDTRLSSPRQWVQRARIVPPIEVLIVSLDNVSPDPGRASSQNDRWAIFWLKEHYRIQPLSFPLTQRLSEPLECPKRATRG